ncbi:DNA polymerase III subunit gamma/tau, partial [Rubricoccus marinus]|uniref:DNA polymerase III subunit gamma/tau n=1 Tax=Rubricoccus marinus TaxID=716817 RepID=UPI001179A694
MADAPDKPRYLVTARKYRPQTFGDLVAQEHVAETLRNAILGDRLAHAYLFSGPRGVGKTTAARLVAKAVNCQTPLAERPDAEPCRTCEACRSFEEGRALNVIEMDAASNNGVDDVRELRETVRIPPQGADKKVYILDEVHMFSAAAFNALLKTLEEPPPYALFVFATTEPHKVLPTILSRTQRFDFRRIQVPEIVGRLREVCEAEGITADEESLVLIARKGDGALRDALSLFDQALSLVGMNLQIGPLREALGVVDEDVFFAVSDRAAQADRAGLITLVDGLVRRGYDLAEFVDGLGEHLRDLMVTRTTGSADLVEGTDTTRARYAQAAGAWAEADLLHLLMLVEQCASDLRDSRQPRLVVELALVKMATLERAAKLDVLLDRLRRIESALAGGASLPTGPASGGAAPAQLASGASASSAPAVQALASAPAASAPAAPQAPPASSAPAQPSASPMPSGASPGEHGAVQQAAPASPSSEAPAPPPATPEA